MSSTYTSLHYHIVYSTKNRIPYIQPNWSNDLHAYLAGTMRGLGGFVIEVGGVSDHVHLLVSLTQNHCVADFVRELKKTTSGWAREHHSSDFRWQEGYAAFTVSPTGRKGVQSYIRNQEQHHGSETFIEELKELLDRAEIEYDPKYLD